MANISVTVIIQHRGHQLKDREKSGIQLIYQGITIVYL